MQPRRPAPDTEELRARLSTDPAVARHLLSALADNPDQWLLVVSTDIDGTIVHASGGGLARLGYRPSDLVGWTVRDRFGHGHPFFSAMPLLERGAAHVTSWMRTHEDDPVRWDLRCIPFVTRGGLWRGVDVWGVAVEGPDLPTRPSAAMAS